jgi:hypothetical protein
MGRSAEGRAREVPLQTAQLPHAAEQGRRGYLFDWLVELKFPLAELPSHVVNAVLFCHAAKTAKVEDGIARYVSKNELSSLSNDKKRSLVMEADGIIIRAKKLVEEHKLGNAAEMDFVG